MDKIEKYECFEFFNLNKIHDYLGTLRVAITSSHIAILLRSHPHFVSSVVRRASLRPDCPYSYIHMKNTKIVNQPFVVFQDDVEL